MNRDIALQEMGCRYGEVKVRESLRNSESLPGPYRVVTESLSGRYRIIIGSLPNHYRGGIGLLSGHYRSKHGVKLE